MYEIKKSISFLLDIDTLTVGLILVGGVIMIVNTRLTVALVGLICSANWAQAFDIAGLSKLTPGRVRAENALWIETPLEKRFDSSKKVVIADLKGPATITMIHFAVSQRYARTKGQ